MKIYQHHHPVKTRYFQNTRETSRDEAANTKRMHSITNNVLAYFAPFLQNTHTVVLHNDLFSIHLLKWEGFPI